MKRKQKRLGKKKEGTTQKQFGTLTQKENAIHTNFQKKPHTFKNKFSLGKNFTKKVCVFILSCSFSVTLKNSLKGNF